ncbi:putative metal-binding, possibly nucleic acid-binding protein [Thioalkalivibrio nitratireducens DSM 14787]|uniref:Large ribosomal RNA subunit accumulation protein YceD n=1 Tax=Thioalkalivibrio nitratireducens (strain DSM 14787 / UNIQEM 213 / ALEN2) TaxID=1255043 RepID=L0DVI7_THIND|nr:YceD family protein [Thioalkalivibrio nitratireducens]AGA33043.1 putative metal-binding, possibly nucleic acid-binding protein [Thioalkalivibrio nitratireducens DSM 14787]
MTRIPVSLDPFLPRALNQRWEGDYSAKDLPRVAAAARGADVTVHAALTIVKGALGEIRLRGTIEGSVGQQCQRCLQPMRWQFRLAPDVALVRPGVPSADLGAGEETVEVEEDGLFRPAGFVEDEILLAWPLSPRHEDCSAGHGREFEPGAVSAEESPFAVLKGMRKGTS